MHSKNKRFLIYVNFVRDLLDTFCRSFLDWEIDSEDDGCFVVTDKYITIRPSNFVSPCYHSCIREIDLSIETL